MPIIARSVHHRQAQHRSRQMRMARDDPFDENFLVIGKVFADAAIRVQPGSKRRILANRPFFHR
ncbi:hypothetical protein H1215_19300, partial [Anoxybacillus sp. LAT_38]